MLIIEPNLRNHGGHYAEFVRALGVGAGEQHIEVFAHPDADRFLQQMQGVRSDSSAPRADQPLAEWRVINRCISTGRPFLVLTADGRHTAAASLISLLRSRPLGDAKFYFHSRPTGVKALLLGMSGRAKRQALVITHTAKLAEDLRRQGWRRALYQPYPALGPPSAPQPAPFRHVLMAGAARLNKGLDLVAPMLQLWTEQRRDIPLLIQVSRKHAHRHGSKEAALVDAILRCNYAALRTDDGSPDRPQYSERFIGALVLAPYEQRRFAGAVSGVVLDALLHGAPVIATRGTWPGAQVERFGAGVTIDTRTPAALADAVDGILAQWDAYSAPRLRGRRGAGARARPCAPVPAAD